jgi:putative flippase GtrA
MRRVEKVKEIGKKYGIYTAVQFGIAGVIGFLVLEGVLILGLYAIYGEPNLPSNLYSSPPLLGLDVFASVVGVTVGFFVNERTTARGVSIVKSRGRKSATFRLAKFQGVYVVGNAITIGVQLALLATLSVSPALGNVIGAVVAYPPSYLISMRVVWRT